MMSSVPQFIDIEDKVAGPLTWKQLGWMMAMGGTILIWFSALDKVVAIIASIPTVLLFVALAFYKPNGFPLTSFIGQSMLFLFRPKTAVWERPVPVFTPIKKEVTKKVEEVREVKSLSPEKLRELARLIDSQGNR